MKKEQFEELTAKEKEYKTFMHLRETALNTRTIRNNAQFFFWLTAIGGALAVAAQVLNRI
jgi:hypothetical protein